MSLFRTVKVDVALNKPDVHALRMYSDSPDAIEFEVTQDGANPVDFTGFTFGVRIYTGVRHIDVGSVARRPVPLTVSPSTVGVTMPQDSTGGIVRVELQTGDLVAGDSIVTLELWAIEDSSWERTLVALARISIITSTA